MRSFLVFITSHNRAKPLLALLQSFEAQKGERPVSVCVLDDASTEDYSSVRAWVTDRPWAQILTCSRNHGKRNFWRTYQMAFSLIEWGKKYDLYAFLPDDIEICADFFEKTDRTWSGISDPRKMALNVLFDDRCLNQNWTGIKSRRVVFDKEEVYFTGWIDCAFVCERRLVEVLDYQMDPIHPKRWAENTLASSGVGQQISTRLVKAGYSLYSVSASMLRLLPVESHMNPVERRIHPISDIGFNRAHKVTFSVASIPARMRNLQRVVLSILHQTDRLNVYLNGYPKVPAFLVHPKITVATSQKYGDLSDRGKFFWIDQADGYQFTVDDDLLYPRDYADHMIMRLKGLGKCIATVHGANICLPFRGYFESRKVFPCLQDLKSDVAVNIGGSGVMAWHSSVFKPKLSEFRAGGMADIWVSISAKRQGVPIVVVRHRVGWLKPLPELGGTLYQKHKNNCEVQTRAILAEMPWPLTPPGRA